MKLCSACLLGIKCRYDGESQPHENIIKLAKREILIPVCPEQLGGLPTPREWSEIKEKGVYTRSGKNITENYKKGAEETLRIAKLYGVKEAILKQRSPSCGTTKIYDGTFSGKVVEGEGITAGLLKKNGIKVISEEDL